MLHTLATLQRKHTFPIRAILDSISCSHCIIGFIDSLCIGLNGIRAHLIGDVVKANLFTGHTTQKGSFL